MWDGYGCYLPSTFKLYKLYHIFSLRGTQGLGLNFELTIDSLRYWIREALKKNHIRGGSKSKSLFFFLYLGTSMDLGVRGLDLGLTMN